MPYNHLDKMESSLGLLTYIKIKLNGDDFFFLADMAFLPHLGTLLSTG